MQQVSRFTRLLCVTLAFLFLLPATISIAQRPDAPDYALRGDYVVGTQNLTIEDPNRPLEVTIWYPAINTDDLPEETVYQPGTLLQLDGRAISDAQPDTSSAPYPLVIFSHGSSGFRFQSRYLTEHLASHGFIVMAADHTTNTITDLLGDPEFSDNLAPNFIHRPQDILRIISLADDLTAEGTFEGIIDVERIGVLGHSFGGYTALAASGIPINLTELGNWCDAPTIDNVEDIDGICFLLNFEDSITDAAGLTETPDGAFPIYADPRIRATIAYAPWNYPILDHTALETHSTPTMIFGGTADDTTPPLRDAFEIYASLDSAPKTLITLENAGHYVYVDECWQTAITFGFYASCSDAVWDMARVHDLINHFTTAFLLTELYEHDTARAALDPANVSFIGVDYETTTP
ncbi:MAG: alpha/beta fold hydrolase [Aggregatilineales bacterium]